MMNLKQLTCAAISLIILTAVGTAQSNQPDSPAKEPAAGPDAVDLVLGAKKAPAIPTADDSEPGVLKPVTKPEPAPEPPSRAELQQARLAFVRLAEQIRIAEAKLDETALQRMREIGRYMALIAATEDQIANQAALVQQRSERYQQIRDQLANLAELHRNKGQDTGHAQSLIAAARQQVEVEQRRLERLSRNRKQLEQRLNEVRGEHLMSLLEAAVRLPDVDQTKTSAIEQVLDEALGDDDSDNPLPDLNDTHDDLDEVEQGFRDM